MHTALASQKADYLFGVVLIGFAFFIQIVSFLIPSEVQALNLQLARWASWVVLPITACSFLLLRLVASRVAVNFEKEIVEWLKENP
jgi:ABC-type sulfate transport system permease component